MNYKKKKERQKQLLIEIFGLIKNKTA